jgi:ferritin-like metal-binding protein YciE
VEHYEIASYGTVRSWAERRGHKESVRLLHETLEEEKSADEKLTEIAEDLANSEAEEWCRKEGGGFAWRAFSLSHPRVGQ